MNTLDVAEIQRTPLWAHMSQLVSHIIGERPQNGLESVIPTSYHVNTGSAVPPKPECAYADSRETGAAAVSADAIKNRVWAVNFRDTLAPPKPPKKPRNGEEDEEEEEDPAEQAENEADDFAMQATLSDVVREQRYCNAVGVGLKPDEAFRLSVGLRRLLRSEPLSSATFWGVIYGTRGDYYIAEAKIDPSRVPEGGDEEEPEDVDEDEGQPIEGVAKVLSSYIVKKHHTTAPEEAGTGVNEFVYYTCSTVDTTRWSRLPDLSPHQICAARKIRRAFTGDLEAPVLGHPRFPGVEKHYLRAQIARIHCACKIAPKDIYTTEGAQPEEEEDEEGNVLPIPSVVPAYPQLPPLLPQEVPDEEDTEAIQPIQAWFRGYPDDELLQGKYWVHIAPTLLQQGRTTLDPPRENVSDDDEPPANEDPVDNTEKITPFLSDLSRDAPLTFPGHSRANFNAWTFRRAYRHESSSQAIYLARSVLWPGAMTTAVVENGKPGAEFHWTYFGTGLKNLQGIQYCPPLPPKPLFEYSEGPLVLQRDCTVDEEIEYAPLPSKPVLEEDEVDEEED